MTVRPFHLAFQVTSLEAAEDFYAGTLGCATGRRSGRWIDFDFFGHQISAHLVEAVEPPASGEVDGDKVPSRHFGASLPWGEWRALAQRLQGAGVDFTVAPKVRFQGAPGQQGTFFITDPAGNQLEFKSFKDPAMIFAAGDGHDFA